MVIDWCLTPTFALFFFSYSVAWFERRLYKRGQFNVNCRLFY